MGTLAMVEDPRQADHPSGNGENSPIPITSSLRATIKHLHASAGRWFWLRGSFFFIGYLITTNGDLTSLIPGFDDRSWLVQTLVYLFIGVLFTNWEVTWVHAVISQPSPKSFLERLLQYRCTGAIMSAAATHTRVISAAWKCSSFLQNAALRHFDIRHNYQNPYQIFALALLPNTVQCIVSVAVRILFVRIAASTLPTDEPPIVPLDPNLGDQSVGIDGVWNTLNSPALGRAWKILKWQFAISMAITLLGEMVKPGFHEDINFPLVWFY